MRVDVKICGLCRPADAAAAHAAGARYAGVILTAGFRRSQTLEAAAAIYAAAGDAVRVGVFVDESAERVAEVARALDLAVVQLHGAETAGHIDALRALLPVRIWKALRATDAKLLQQTVGPLAGKVDALLLDGNKQLGAGSTFPWDAFGGRASFPSGLTLGIAGGLTPANVSAAVAHFTPDFVDVSSGVEVSVGHKSPELLHAFIAAATSATQPTLLQR
jgi:phosphoribosylanthranilate isomerase